MPHVLCLPWIRSTNTLEVRYTYSDLFFLKTSETNKFQTNTRAENHKSKILHLCECRSRSRCELDVYLDENVDEVERGKTRAAGGVRRGKRRL